MSWKFVLPIIGVVMVAWNLHARFGGQNREEAHRLVASGAVLLDVRTREEFNAAHIDNAKNIPVQELAARMKEIGASKDQPIVVYCRSGARSATARKMLLEAGFKTVLDLGAMSNW